MNSAQFFTNRPQPAAHIMAAKDAAAAVAASSAKAQQPFVIPLGVDSLVAAHSAGEVACRRFMSAVDEPYLKQRGLPLTLLKGCQSGELPAVNEVTQSLRDHATASLTPTIVRQGFLLAHLFNMRYCKVVEALHQNPQQSLSNRTISSSNKAALEENCHGHAQQQTCGGSSGWLEDLQLCVELTKGKREVGKELGEEQQNEDEEKTDRKATPQDTSSPSSPPSSPSIEKNAASSTGGGQAPAPSAEVLAQYVRFGAHSWMRILPAALNLAAKINHVMIRRHVMRYCILDNCQRVSGTNVTVPAPCAWISQLQSYEIAMLEVLSSHRLADRRIPEGHLRLLLWSLQSAVGNEWSRQNQINENDDEVHNRENKDSGGSGNSTSSSNRIVFPAEGFFAPLPQSSPSPHGMNADTAAATTNLPKLAQSFREAVQMGAMALLTFCYRSTELLLYGSICTVNKQTKGGRMGGDDCEDNGGTSLFEDNATTTTTTPARADSSTPPAEEKWSAATEVGSFRSGLLAHYSGESASFDAAVMCFVTAFSHTLEITLGASRRNVMAIRKVFFKELVESVLSQRAEEYAIARGWIEPPTPHEQPSSPLPPALSTSSSLSHRPMSPLVNAPPLLPPAGMKPYAYVAPQQPSQPAPLSSSLSPLGNSSSANYYSVLPANAATLTSPPNVALLPSTTAFSPTQKAPFSSSSAAAAAARGSVDPPPTPDALEAYFVDFVRLFSTCSKDEVVKRDSPSPAMLDYFSRVAKLVA